MATKTKTGLCAISLTIVAFLFVIISFCTPCWLETDGEVEDPKFIRIGTFSLNLKVFGSGALLCPQKCLYSVYLARKVLH